MTLPVETPVRVEQTHTSSPDTALVVENATQAIEVGSKSFAAAARLFDEATRESAVMLYAWCRHCDDVIDGQELGHGQREGDRSNGAALLAALESATRRACATNNNTSSNTSSNSEALDTAPVFAGLAEVVRRHGIPECYPLEHLAGFRMDIDNYFYASLDDTLAYSWRVAGVVGVMMSLVMGNRKPETLDRACDLGMAFQLTNIARDVVEDAAIGRVYLPADWLAAVGIDSRDPANLLLPEHREALGRVAARLVDTAEPYYRSAVGGIADLPLRSAWSIATARGVYRDIGRQVKAQGAKAWDQRIATSRLDKLWFVARGAAVALATHGGVALPARDAGLWTRPV